MTARWAWALVALVGCSFETAPTLEAVDNGCRADTDCLEGVCDGRICIDDSGASVEVAIEVAKAASESGPAIPASWAFASQGFAGPNVRDLVLPATRQVRGTVRWEGVRVPATLRFVRRMATPIAALQPVAIEIDTLRDAGGGDGEESYDFRTVLVAGETYDVVVLPSSDMVTSPANDVGATPALRSLPPAYLEMQVEEGEPTEPFRFDVSFPSGLADPCDDDQTTGCTLEAEIVSFDGEEDLPEPRLQVRAIDEATGRVVSSIGETDESGHFAIRIGVDAPDYVVRVTSSVGEAPFPSVSVDPEVAFADDASRKVIRIPRLTPVQFTGRVRDEKGSAVPGATVRFLSNGIFDGSQLGLQGSFSGSATTNEDGSFGTQLLPGYYAVTVTPPADVESSWAVLSAEALVGPEVTAVEALIVPSKVEFLGWVRTFREEAAVGVTVAARARASGDASAMHRSQEAVSNSLGRFTLRMDLGIYDVAVKVPSQTGFAWLVEPALAMEDDLARTYRFPPPIPIEGVVLSSDGIAVPGASIRAFVLSDDGSSTRPLQVAETTSDEEGNYRLLIDPGLGAD